MNKETAFEELKFNDTPRKNMEGETVVLGTLVGPCADIINPTRNGRLYTEELWDRVFNSDIIKEYFESGGILGELDHPTDRSETCMEKVAICMSEPPKKDENGKLIGRWDILSTPNGRIAYTLAKYGYKLGISSRGTGDVYDDYDGTSKVDEDTYDFQAFDLVLLPAVKAARLQMVESLNTSSFKKAINESLNCASDHDKQVMRETLDNLNIDYKVVNESIDSKSTNETKAINVGLDVVKDLQESLKREKELKEQLVKLQEKLSVSNAKETKLNEELDKYKSAVITLSDKAKAAKGLNSKIDSLNDQLAEANRNLSKTKDAYNSLLESHKVSSRKTSTLNESVNQKNDTIKELQNLIESLKSSNASEIEKLNGNLEEVKKNYLIKVKELNEKINQSKKVVDKYKTIAHESFERYIGSKADMLGISPNEIKNRLSENYSFDAIDRVCESLQDYQLNVNRLPFELTRNDKVKVKVTESKEPIRLMDKFSDDEVDDQLLKMFNINN